MLFKMVMNFEMNLAKKALNLFSKANSKAKLQMQNLTSDTN